MATPPNYVASIRQIERAADRERSKNQAEQRISTLQESINTLTQRITECNNQLKTTRDVYRLSWIKTTKYEGVTVITTVTVLKELTRQEVEDIKSELILEKRELSRELARLVNNFERQFGVRTTSATGGGGGTAGAVAEAPPVTYSKTVLYNASAVKEAYFYTGMSFVNKADPDWQGNGATDKFDSSIWSGNTPGKVNDARDLWQNTVTTNSKGMIQTWLPPGNRASYVTGTDGNFATLSSRQSIQRYGFQFLYNPTTIEMSYGGVADVDPGMQSSGTEEFLLTNSSVFQSTIGIQVIINRMFDFQYINKTGVKSGQISDFYAGNVPNNAEIKKIYNKGTMYDVEYLLQTMFPFEPYESQLRDKTSDIGFLGASPVELHLGNKLRYVAQINNISVNHVIFDNRMVPLFTTISISTNRIPDYKAAGTSAGITSSSSSAGSSNTTVGGSAVNDIPIESRRNLK
jgi:hypothetical protein